VQALASREPSKVLAALVTELAWKIQSKTSDQCDGKVTAMHTVSDESLRVQCIGHIDAFPPVGLNRTVDNVSRLGEDYHDIQDVRQGHADPFGYIRPALFASQMSDLAAPRKALEFTK